MSFHAFRWISLESRPSYSILYMQAFIFNGRVHRIISESYSRCDRMELTLCSESVKMRRALVEILLPNINIGDIS